MKSNLKIYGIIHLFHLKILFARPFMKRHNLILIIMEAQMKKTIRSI